MACAFAGAGWRAVRDGAGAIGAGSGTPRRWLAGRAPHMGGAAWLAGQHRHRAGLRTPPARCEPAICGLARLRRQNRAAGHVGKWIHG
ncbi:hypothetical protein G6F53_013990 [Rhizopus delemar]|nr:hypothetical protein G6F53_013990 [Rhizopus delemar]